MISTKIHSTNAPSESASLGLLNKVPQIDQRPEPSTTKPGTGLFLSGPGSCGPVLVARSRVPVARSRWPGPDQCRAAPPFFAVARWPGPGPGPGLPSVLPRSGFGGPVARSRSRLRSALMAVARSRSRSRSRWPGPGGPVPVARSRWPGPGGLGPSPNKADHLCSVASFNASRHGCAISSRNMVVLRCSPNHW